MSSERRTRVTARKRRGGCISWEDVHLHEMLSDVIGVGITVTEIAAVLGNRAHKQCQMQTSNEFELRWCNRQQMQSANALLVAFNIAVAPAFPCWCINAAYAARPAQCTTPFRFILFSSFCCCCWLSLHSSWFLLLSRDGLEYPQFTKYPINIGCMLHFNKVIATICSLSFYTLNMFYVSIRLCLA